MLRVTSHVPGWSPCLHHPQPQPLPPNTPRPLKSEDEARQHWQFWHGYLSTPGNCVHAVKCAVKARGGTCVAGNSNEERQIISGAILPVYKGG